MNYKKIILIFFICGFQSFAQTNRGWQNYSSLSNVSSAIVEADGIWAGTDGGAFSYSFKDSSFQTFTKTEGVNGSPITAIAKDSTGNIWIGSQNGKIDVYNPATKVFKNIFDIYNSERTEKRINSISIYGDTAFVSTSFGLSLVNTKTFAFYDTFFKLGNFASNIEVNFSYKKNNIIYAATNAGIAVQKAGTTNLVAPESWNNFSTANGLNSNTILKIGSYKDSVFVLTPVGFSIFTINAWQNFLTDFPDGHIQDFQTTSDSIFILSDWIVYYYTNGLKDRYSPIVYVNAAKMPYCRDGKFLLTFTNTTRLFDKNNSYSSFNLSPNGPSENKFFNMAVDQQNNLWVATGQDVGGVGFFKFNGTLWKTFDMNSFPFLSNAFHNVSIGSDNSIYFANWGSGFVRVKNDTTIQSFSVNNTPLIGTLAHPNFLVIADMKTDSRNNLWALNHDAADRKVLSVLTTDSTWYLFENLPDPTVDQYRKLLIDQYDTKWFTSSNPDKSGLYYFNENSTLSNSSDDRTGYVAGLNSNGVSCLALDKRGELWAGTNLGVNIISNPNAILSSSSSALKITSVFSLRQQAINCLAVDAINRKWVGTNQGLIVTSSDGTSLLETFDSKNSPLLADQIKSLAVDEKNGIVYAAVDGGLTAFYTTALAPNTSFTSIETSPSPFLIGGTASLLTIDGLIKDSDIKILSISGNLIREFSSPGGRIAFWDGKNDDGKFVNSGIYLIVAYDKEGNSVATGKVAIIRK
ncbi:MAG: two-component regulator propeller domain-containing protein [Ignavibacteria bacterium]|nr:two-component regulator propeller domain-containing protein [Ignavibacteria bacterium]